eukprot:6194932-Pleurochrysis_carterae.AAC.3
MKLRPIGLAVSLHWIAVLSFISYAEQSSISNAPKKEHWAERSMRPLSLSNENNSYLESSVGHLSPVACGNLSVALASRVHLYAFVTGLQSSLLEHWLSHYLSLGVDLRNRAQIHLHVASKESTREQGELEKSRKLLRKFAGPSSVIEDKAWSSNLKTQMANAYIAKLPSNAMVIYPDLDEFFEYKVSMHREWQLSAKASMNLHRQRPAVTDRRTAQVFGCRFAQCEHLQIVANSLSPVAIRGHMEDRLGKDFKFSPVAERVPLARQFPNRCRAIRLCLGSRGDKFTLVPVRDQKNNLIQYRMAHSFNCPGSNISHVNDTEAYALGANGCANIRVLQALYSHGNVLLRVCFTAGTFHSHGNVLLRVCFTAGTFYSHGNVLLRVCFTAGTSAQYHETCHLPPCVRPNQPTARIRWPWGPPFPHYHFTEHTAIFTKHKLKQYVNDYVLERSQRNMTAEESRTINSFIKSRKYAMELSHLFVAKGHVTYLHEWCRRSCNEEAIFEIADAATRIATNKSSGFVLADGVEVLRKPASIKSDHKMLITQAWEAREGALHRHVSTRDAN